VESKEKTAIDKWLAVRLAILLLAWMVYPELVEGNPSPAADWTNLLK